MHLSDRVLSMREAATLRMAQMARELGGQGKDVVNLTVGEPDFDTPEWIKQAAKDALDQGFTKYTPVPGLPELRAAICRKFKRDNDLDYDVENIVVSTGAKQSITNTCLAMINPGDEVILFAPYWVSYFEMVRVAGGIPVIVEAGIDQDFKVTASQLQEALTPKTRLIIFNTPCNPSGSVYSAAELEQLAEVIRGIEGLYLISDERHVSIATLAGMKDRTITVNGMSKGYAMTGWRIGYLAAPVPIARAVAKIQGQFTSGTNAFAQKASAVALDGPLDDTLRMRDGYQQRKALVRELLADIPGLIINDPEGAFYIFPDASAYMQSDRIGGSEALCEYLLTEALVALVPGIAFGNDACFRISFAASEEELREGILRIGRALASL
jgi:aspartate aminotransferase